MKKIIEKIKACWHILTNHTYYVICINNKKSKAKVYIKNPTLFIDDSIILFLKSEAYINYNYKKNK